MTCPNAPAPNADRAPNADPAPHAGPAHDGAAPATAAAPTPGVTVSPLCAGDYDDWLPLWTGYLAFYETPLADDVTRLAFDRLTSGDTPMFGLLARNAAGAAVGLVHWLPHLATWSANEYAYLEDLFVAPCARRTGAGRALIEAVYAAARARNCTQVYWLTKADNATARRLYDDVADYSGSVHYRYRL
ncbi:MAG: GNAT family N-acetyltransferase [Sphingopyxis sp.]